MGNFIRFLFSRAFVINVLIAIFFISAVIYFALFYLEKYTLHGEMLEVPEYRGMIWDDTLGQANPNFELLISDSIYQKGAEMGLILDQDPLPSKTVKSGRKIYLTVSSSNPPMVSMPSLVDLSLRQATSLMEIYGLQIGELTYKPDLCTNCILEQKMNGKVLDPGHRVLKGATIDLVVGQGLSKEQVPVPYLIGLTANEANELLKSKSLNVGSLNFDPPAETEEDSLMAQVFKQYPTYDEEPSIFMGSSVDLYLTIDTNRIVHSVNPSESE